MFQKFREGFPGTRANERAAVVIWGRGGISWSGIECAYARLIIMPRRLLKRCAKIVWSRSNSIHIAFGSGDMHRA